MTSSPASSPGQNPGRLLLWLAAGIFVILQINLWFGEGGILDVHRLKSAVALQQAENLRLRQRNQVLQAEVTDLKTGSDAIEERARLDLGMIKDNETFYLITGKALAGSVTSNGPQPATPAVMTSAPASTTAAGAPAAATSVAAHPGSPATPPSAVPLKAAREPVLAPAPVLTAPSPEELQ